ncbi:MAG: hypothetical protein JO146_00930 [Candidatus Eremiobacteraeota bacterium]|nr:hypothetical protein [Candidatus Eremiobacteraeota bacterium]
MTARPAVAGPKLLDSYIRSLVLPNGALANSNAPNATHVTPYLGAYAAIGLSLSGDAATALGFERWYVANLNARGIYGPGCTIYDFTFTRDPFSMSSTGKADATDAPAAVFLTAMYYLYETGDRAARRWIVTQERHAQCIAEASTGLFQSEYDCTAALPGYNFCLAEDNFEVWRGLGAIAWLEQNAWENPRASSAYFSDQAIIAAGLAQFWNRSNGNYNWARSTITGRFTASSWTQFYPGAVTQLWPEFTGYAAPSDPRSLHLWRSFKSAWPEMPYRSPVESPWPLTALTAAVMGDSRFLAEYADGVNACYQSLGYPYYWESADGGNMLTALLWSPLRHHSRLLSHGNVCR